MRNIWMLASAKLKKNKGQTASLLLLVMIAAILLIIGLVISLRVGSFFDEQAELSNAAHFSGIYEADSGNIEKGRQFMEAHPDVTEIETVNAVGGWGNMISGGLEIQCLNILARAEAGQKIEPLTLTGESRPLTGDAIYIPYSLMLREGYILGDSYKLKISGYELNFTVAGATKEITFSSTTDPFYRFYISDENFNSISEQLPQSGLTLLLARLKSIENSSPFQIDYLMNVSSDGMLWYPSYDNAKGGHIAIPSIASAGIVAFAFIILIVSLILIRFRIINSIEESITNIGTQKAVGYQSFQIVLAIVLQFGLIALAGGIIGAAVSQAVLPMFMKVWESMLGLIWIPKFDAAISAVSLLVLIFASMLVSFLSALKITKLHPLAALRGGANVHNFSKNRLALDRVNVPLSLTLALKQVLRNKKQTAAISIIVSAVTVASVMGVTLNYNINENRDSFIRSMFGEVPYLDVKFELKNDVNSSAFKERLLEHPDVRKVNGFDDGGNTLLINSTGINVIVVEDCSLLESDMIIEGRNPIHDNEIALGILVSKVMGVSIGDTVNIGSSENLKEYLVTGFVQTTHNNGLNGIINLAGLKRLQPGYEFKVYGVYLNEGVDAKAFIQDIQAAEGDIFEMVIEEQNQVDSMMRSVGGIFAAISIGIWGATVFVIILVLHMVIKTTILRRRRALGIQKAVGFTTLQLMNQIALNMTPVILLGVLIGAAAGYFCVTPVITMMFSGMGIVKLQLAIPAGQILIVSLALVILAYVISMLISWRIRKISAYGMVTE